MKVTNLATSSNFHMSMVYAFNGIFERLALWAQLLKLSSDIHGPWIICGDFNCVLTPAERLGGHTSIAEMDDFQFCLNGCGLVDSPAVGSFFTWNNKQDVATRVYTRLDRALVNSDWTTPKNLEYIQEHLRSDPTDSVWLAKEHEAIADYKELKIACESFLDQKAKSEWINDGDSNTKAFLDYYIGLLGTTIDTDPVNVNIIRKGKVCEAHHYDILAKPVTKEEIMAIIFSIPDNKLLAQMKKKMLKQLDATMLNLIPKCKLPANVTQFRPIACCNVLYKVISKLLSARLGAVLPDLVSLKQGGFVQGRSIVENILICQDLVRLYNRQSCSPRCMFKIDLMKSYDSVSWNFIEEMLVALQFPSSFRDMSMLCVTTTSFSISLNGDMFDDLLMFCKGEPHSIMILLRAFSAFSTSYGLNMNALKSCAYFNGMDQHLTADILKVSGFVEGKLPFKYLGVPITAGRLRNKDCTALIDRIRSLGAKKLSYAGRLILVALSTIGLLLAWYKVYVSKEEGGLGLRKGIVWNMAVLSKVVWWLVVKADKLWVKWVHHLYFKGSHWSNYIPTSDISWHWKQIYSVMIAIKSGFDGDHWVVGNEKLFRLNIATDDTYYICCATSNTLDHLLNQCSYVLEVWGRVEGWLRCSLSASDKLRSIKQKRWSNIRKRVTTLIVLAVWYSV
ncbi:uncharacterized protein LOC141654134 [Silene latifolia]|uniref:uncharacterized protein LOC141654134 n=1 Tax=Silene latifolia TaxID=37657 RepID=UPI003D785873